MISVIRGASWSGTIEVISQLTNKLCFVRQHGGWINKDDNQPLAWPCTLHYLRRSTAIDGDQRVNCRDLTERYTRTVRADVTLEKVANQNSSLEALENVRQAKRFGHHVSANMETSVRRAPFTEH